MEPNKMKQKRRKYLYAAAALGMTFLLNLSGCSRRFTNYPETAGTVAIVDSTEREAVRDENGENPDQPIDLDNLGEQQSAAEMEALAAAEAAEPGVEEPYLDGGELRLLACADIWQNLSCVMKTKEGAESGDNEILKYINKGVTAEQTIEAGQKLKRCGIATSVTLISGLGGRSKVEEHALSCAKLITAMNPEYASFLTLRLYEGTPMYADVVEGRFQRITPDEIVDEMEIFLKNVDSPGTVFRTNHASNYVILAGTLNGDIPAMLKKLEEAKRTHHYRKFRETGDLL